MNKDVVIKEIKDLMNKYEYMSSIRTMFILEDLQNIITKITGIKEPETQLEETQHLYAKRY